MTTPTTTIPMTRSVLVLALLLSPASLAAQVTSSADSPLRGRQVALEATTRGGAASYAKRIAPGRLLGVQVGIGGDQLNRTLVGSPHFTDDDRHDIRERAHAAVFVRQEVTTWFTVDAGARVAPFRHDDLPGDESTVGMMAGVYAMPMFGGRYVSVGPRLTAGVMSESTAKTALGLNLVPMVVRVTFR